MTDKLTLAQVRALANYEDGKKHHIDEIGRIDWRPLTQRGLIKFVGKNCLNEFDRITPAGRAALAASRSADVKREGGE